MAREEPEERVAPDDRVTERPDGREDAELRGLDRGELARLGGAEGRERLDGERTRDGGLDERPEEDRTRDGGLDERPEGGRARDGDAEGREEGEADGRAGASEGRTRRGASPPLRPASGAGRKGVEPRLLDRISSITRRGRGLRSVAPGRLPVSRRSGTR